MVETGQSAGQSSLGEGQSGLPGKAGGRVRRAFWTAVMWLAIAVFVAVAGCLGIVAYTYWDEANRYQELSDAAFTPPAQDAAPEQALAHMEVDWDALRAVNPEVVAWIHVPGTRISYPVCFSGDNQKYLDVDFDGRSGVFTGSGAIFLDGDAKPDFSGTCNFLFGHHMNDGSMFACLSDFADPEVFEASRTVYLLTPAGNYEYRTFALVRTVGSDYLVVHDFADAAEKDAYVADKESRSVVQPGEGFPQPSDVKRIIALSTCDYNEENGRAVLFGQLVGEVPSDQLAGGLSNQLPD
jgi:sortase B